MEYIRKEYGIKYTPSFGNCFKFRFVAVKIYARQDVTNK